MPFTSGFKKAPISVLEYSQYILSMSEHNSNISFWCFTTSVTHYKEECRKLPGQSSSSNSPRNTKLTTPLLLKRPLFSYCVELPVQHGEMDMKVQDFSGLCLDHSREVQGIVTSSALTKATGIQKILLCRTFPLPWLWKKNYRGNI